MKRIKQFTSRILAVMLAGTLAVGSVSVSAFGEEDAGSTAVAAEEFSLEEATENSAAEATATEEADREVMTESSSAEIVDREGVSESPDAAFADTSEIAAEEAAVASYTVTLDANGGYFVNEWDDVLNETLEKTEVLNKIVPVGGMVSVVPVKELEGTTATFLGWSLERDGEIFSQEQEGYAPVGDCVLYAVWKYDDAADSSVAIGEDVPEEVLNNPIETENPEASTPEGGVDQENNNEDVLIDETVAEENAEEAPASYAVTLDANGGYFVNEWDDVLGEYVEHAEILNKVIPVEGVVSIVPVNEQDGITATFLGWSLERDGEILPQEQEGYAPVGDCVLYAIWEVIESENAINNDGIDEAYEAAPAEEASFQDNKEEKEEKIESIDEEAFAAVHETKGIGEYQNSDKIAPEESNKTALKKEKEDSSKGDTAEIAVENDDSNEEFVSEEAMGAAIYAQREYNGHVYQLFNEGVSWSTAKKRCEDKGGHLVTITSSGEYSFCKSLLGDLSPKYCWMGATHASGTWKWITGETWGFTAWSPNQPNGSGGGTYALMQNFKGVGSAWNWDDQGNSGTSPSEKYKGSPYYHLTKNYCYICEWEKDFELTIYAYGDTASQIAKSNILSSGEAHEGHTWLSITNRSLSEYNFNGYIIKPSHSITMGLWPDTTIFTEGYGGVFINLEKWAYRGENILDNISYYSIRISRQDLETIEGMVPTESYYHNGKNDNPSDLSDDLRHNCSTFAVRVWNKVAEEEDKFKEDDIDVPFNYMSKIISKNLEKYGEARYIWFIGSSDGKDVFHIDKNTNLIRITPMLKQKIEVKASTTEIQVGKTATISITGAEGKISYISSNTGIATVSAKGVVKGKRGGIVKITVTSAATDYYLSASKTIMITVIPNLKKPGNCRFSKWNNAKYSNCQIGWNRVADADGYQSVLSWTDGSHSTTKTLRAYSLSQNCSLAVNHVYQFKVRAFANTSAGKVYSPWSNVEYITPSPLKFTYKNTGTSSKPKAKISWNIIYGCNGYNVFLSTNPNGTWYWNQSTPTRATATSAIITKYRGSKLKKGKKYYVRVVTRRRRNGVFCTVPLPSTSTYIGSFKVK